MFQKPIVVRGVMVVFNSGEFSGSPEELEIRTENAAYAQKTLRLMRFPVSARTEPRSTLQVAGILFATVVVMIVLGYFF